MKYIIGIDQSTQGTKAILVNKNGEIVKRADVSHRQIINEKGWVSHDITEIYQNALRAAKNVIEAAGIDKADLAAMGISNQRETTAAWGKDGEAIGDAVVWQCARAKEIITRFSDQKEMIRKKTGLPLSPYFPAAKMTWIIENVIHAKDGYHGGDVHLGTMDSWLIYKLTGGTQFKTDYSNASRTQLFNLHTLKWDEELCELFGVPPEALPEVCDSNACFGYTDLEGYLEQPIPIHAVMGDSHAALFAQGCHETGMVKTTYGTGSSIMMNIGNSYLESKTGLATSLAWGIDGVVTYVLEGNINYTGAVISWLQNDLGIISSTAEIEPAAEGANEKDTTVLIPAFTGLSAPHWDENAKALLYGMTRTTGRKEIIKAAVESIAFQITDVLKAMERDSGIELKELRVDGGPTRNKYLMQFQSDMAEVAVQVPKAEELSAIGTAYLAGIQEMLLDKNKLFEKTNMTSYYAGMDKKEREKKYARWQQALKLCRGNRS